MKDALHTRVWTVEELEELMKRLGNDETIDWEDTKVCWLADALVSIASQLKEKLGG